MNNVRPTNEPGWTMVDERPGDKRGIERESKSGGRGARWVGFDFFALME